MIVVIRKDTQEPAMRQLAVRLMNQGVRIGRTPGQDADVLTLVGDTWRLDPEGLLALPYVLDVRRITPPYRLAGRAAHPETLWWRWAVRGSVRSSASSQGPALWSPRCRWPAWPGG